MDNVITLRDKSFKIYLEYAKIKARILELAAEIERDYVDKSPLFIAILNGSFIFAADLFKEIKVDCSISFVKLASYKGTTSTGNIINLIGLDEKIQDRHIIILEDIVDTGRTMTMLTEHLNNRNPASLNIITLLLKPGSMEFDIDIRYTGFEIGNDFIVGFGLDYDGLGRNYKDIYKIT